MKSGEKNNIVQSFLQNQLKGVKSMKAGSIATGVSVGLTAGAVAYAISSASSKDKKRLKSRTGKAIRAIGDVMDGISMMMG